MQINYTEVKSTCIFEYQNEIIMKTLTTFRIHTTSEFGIGFFDKKAKSIEDLETDDIRHIEDPELLEDGIISLFI